MGETVLLVDGRAQRRKLLRQALERRGCRVAGEAGSVTELVHVIAALSSAPSTVLVGAKLGRTSSTRVAKLLKRTWPATTVVRETSGRARRDDGLAQLSRGA